MESKNQLLNQLLDNIEGKEKFLDVNVKGIKRNEGLKNNKNIHPYRTSLLYKKNWKSFLSPNKYYINIKTYKIIKKWIKLYFLRFFGFQLLISFQFFLNFSVEWLYIWYFPLINNSHWNSYLSILNHANGLESSKIFLVYRNR